MKEYPKGYFLHLLRPLDEDQLGLLERYHNSHLSPKDFVKQEEHIRW